MRNVVGVLISPSGTFGRIEVEILSAGRRLADEMDGVVTAVVVGPGTDAVAQDAVAYGANKVVRSESPALAEYQPDFYLSALQQAFTGLSADIILFGGNTWGLELAPLFGHRIGASVTLDCISVRRDETSGGVAITKPVYGGKAHWLLVAKKGPAVIAMRPRATQPINRMADRTAEIVSVPLSLDGSAPRSRLIARTVEEGGSVKLEDARIIVSGGRGVGGRENFRLLEQLAQELGGAVGASRAACDLGWVPASLQIGQTGKKVAPELYVAIGISGASQHMVGCSGARHIAAVNKDAKAPIFRAAEFGVAEDFSVFVPALVEALKQRKSG
jgi:electron transfer flavoprotein alpha subunit